MGVHAVAKGIYRDGNWATVDFDTHRVEMPRKRYEEKGYQPPFLDLPSKDQYLFGQQKKL